MFIDFTISAVRVTLTFDAVICGARENRTPDILVANQALYQPEL